MLPLILGGAAAGLLGGWLGTKAANAANRPMQGVQYQPKNVSGPGGSVSYDPTAGFQQQLSPQLQQLMQTWGRTANPGGLTSQEQQMQSLFGKYMMPGQESLEGLSQTELDVMSQLKTMGGPLSTQYTPTDIGALSKQQYGLMQEMMAPGQEQQRKALQEQLFGQGLLGSSAGEMQTTSLEKGIGQQNTAAALAALEQGRSAGQFGLQQYGQLAGTELQQRAQQGGFLEMLGGMGGLERQLESPERSMSLMLQGLQGYGGFQDLVGARQQLGMGALSSMMDIQNSLLPYLQASGQAGGQQLNLDMAKAESQGRADATPWQMGASFFGGLGGGLMSGGLNQYLSGAGTNWEAQYPTY